MKNHVPLKSLAIVTTLIGAQAASACSDRNAAETAVTTGDWAKAEVLYDKIEIDANCDDAFRSWMAEALAREVFRIAMFETNDPVRKQAMFEASLTYTRHWRTLVELANLAQAAGRHDDGALFLQEALNELEDGSQEHSATDDEIREIFRRAVDARFLASNSVAIPATRSGKPGGIFIGSVRNLQMADPDLTLQFEFDSIELTEKGKREADTLLNHLINKGPAFITLVGHTDTKGSEAYNYELSERRAKAIKTFLQQGGFTGRIETIGMGETQPPDVSAVFPQEQLDQRSRRVELGE